MSSSAVRSAIRRWWWVPVIFTLLTLAGALYLYAGPPAAQRPAYVSTTAAEVIVLPSSASTTYATYTQRVSAATIARNTADAGIPSQTFAMAVARAYTRERAALAGQYGEDIPRSITAADLSGLIGATNYGSVVTIRAHWPSAAGAQAIAMAALNALDEGVLTAQVAGQVEQRDIVFQPFFHERNIEVLRDTSVDQAATSTLIGRIALGAVTGIILAAALAAWDVRRARAATATIS